MSKLWRIIFVTIKEPESKYNETFVLAIFLNLMIYWCKNSLLAPFLHSFQKALSPPTNYQSPPTNYQAHLPLQNLCSPVVSVDELFKSERPVAVLVNRLHIKCM